MFVYKQDSPGCRFLKIFPPILAALALAFYPMAASAQAADETAKRFNYLPLVADGEGIQSTLLITNVADSSNQCSLVFLANQLDADDFETHAQVRLDGTGTTVDLPRSGSHVSIVSRDGRTLALDYRDARLRRTRRGEGIDYLERGRAPCKRPPRFRARRPARNSAFR